MTKEEAIAILIHEIDGDIFVRTEYRKKIHEALNMGIKALKQKPCEDAIDRKLVCAFIDGLISDDGEREKGLEYIKYMPSVTPQYTDAEIQKTQELEQAEIEKAYELGKISQPKTGQWIDDCGGAKCSCCGYCIDDYYYVKTYCPNCGARMENKIEE